MSDFSQRIFKAQSTPKNQYFLREVRREIYNNQQKLSREVYNVDTRNIKKFTQELQAYKNKFTRNKEATHTIVPLTVKEGRRKYEENQLLELSFGENFKPKLSTPHPIARQDSAFTIRKPTTDGNSSRTVTFKHSLNEKYSLRINYVELSKSRSKMGGVRQKSNSLIKEEKHPLRKRVATQWELSPHQENTSRISVQKGESVANPTPQYHTQEYLFDMTREKMEKFIRNLHRVEWSYLFFKENPSFDEQSKEWRNSMKGFEFDPDSPINEQSINYMISKRYQLLSSYLQDNYEVKNRLLTEESSSRQLKTLANESEYPLLSSLSKHSILKLMQKHQSNNKQLKKWEELHEKQQPNLYFALPYSQFISYRETKNSIYQLIGMGAKMGLKLAFTIFDKNRNGLVDEDDLIQLISLSRKLPMLEIDISTLSKAMLTFKSKKSFYHKSKVSLKQESPEDKLKGTRQRNKTYGKQSQTPSQILPIQEQQSSESEESDLNQNLSNSRFSIDKLYTFLKDKEKGTRSNMGQFGKASAQPLNFLMFCKAFEFKRPFIIYDLFQFVLGATIEDYKQQFQKEIITLLSKLHPTRASLPQQQEEQSLEEKWNRQIKVSNEILSSFLGGKQKY